MASTRSVRRQDVPRTSCTVQSAAVTRYAGTTAGRVSTRPLKPAFTSSYLMRKLTLPSLAAWRKQILQIRSRSEVESLWRHLASGNITVVSTDHVSWSEDRKSDPDMLKNASGLPGLEVLPSLFLKGLLERRLSPVWAARLLTANPARLFRIGHRKGAFAIGRDADFVVMAHDPHRYCAAASGNNFVGWSPYDGIELPYRPLATFQRGELIFDGAR